MGECIGLSPSLGFVGATTTPGACTGAGGGAWGTHWFAHQVRASARATSIAEVGPVTIVDVDAGGGSRIDGVFSTTGRTFSAVVFRGDGAHALASA